MVAPDFDWNSYLADIDYSAEMISRSTCGDISLVTGQSLNLGAEDLAGNATTIVLKRSGVPGYAAEKIGNSVGLETSLNE